MDYKKKIPVYLYYEDIFREMDEENIKYLLIGGVAVNLHGIPRATGDIDMLIAMEKKNVQKFVEITKKLGLKPKIPVQASDLADSKKLKEWKKEKNMQVFSFIHPDNPYITIDIMTENYISFEQAYKRRKKTKAWGINVSVASIPDLIKLKEISGRTQDLADIEALKKYGKK
ncbi:hypothetical protein A2230_05915 [candidate division WOR-1 bacterium RIFOXYA2_FULL_36_21]|uniref:DUF6036 domain-containing protein n=1 Tax=candidate division WOR-1 bacterium RIFOXYB2_FULL_36_35 TaxID=1802578 RepID=A0A1F4S7Q4_UNCSA|nr:MAG: hypothetical protein A2230_05915 [candidate division WOR-1 bacterium RIFOXYA2_FULL_36_21]OGC16417.1 MAG: hypothetical protein A2290_02190 [candidate division WOR-1 bacterium RIFOXYB2_FULL_36_35]